MQITNRTTVSDELILPMTGTMTDPMRFLFSPDKHVGFETVMGKHEPIHDQRAIDAMLAFATDFKPQVWIEGGDQLDLGCISHWNAESRLSTEGLRLQKDCDVYRTNVLNIIENEIVPDEAVWMRGNHCAWLDQLLEKNPGLSGALSFEKLLGIEAAGWTDVPQGDMVNLGKLTFVHGDRISGGEHVAKAAVIQYERSIRFGHFHTAQTYTKHSPVSTKLTKSGISVGCLCKKGPMYGKKAPNKWSQGFLFGWVFPDGSYTDYAPVIVDGKFAANGKVYKG